MQENITTESVDVDRSSWPKTDDELHAFNRAAKLAAKKAVAQRTDADVALIASHKAWRDEGSKLMVTPKQKAERTPAERVRYFVDGRRQNDSLSRIHEVAFAYTRGLVPERARLTTKEFETLLFEEHSVENARTHGWSATLRNGRRITACPFETTDEPSKLAKSSVQSSKPELGVVEPKQKAERKRSTKQEAAEGAKKVGKSLDALLAGDDLPKTTEEFVETVERMLTPNKRGARKQTVKVVDKVTPETTAQAKATADRKSGRTSRTSTEAAKTAKRIGGTRKAS